jgi:hypothetical protein
MSELEAIRGKLRIDKIQLNTYSIMGRRRGITIETN